MPRPWHVLHSETLFDFPPWLRLVRQSVQLANGSRLDDYFLTPTRDYSMTFALTEANEVLLVQQYKHGLGQVILDFPAGYLDSPTEDPLTCAQRELREETGYTARTWTPLGAWGIDSNRMPNVAHLFFARGLTRVAEPQLDGSEDLTLLFLPVNEIPARLRSGQMPTLACAALWGLAAPHLFG
jgi:ADP-ribose pyrophosphatase